MAVTINGTTGVAGVDGSASTPALQGSDTNTGVSFGTDTVNINTGGSTRATVDSSGKVGIGTASPSHHYNQGIHVHATGTGACLHLTDNTTGSGVDDGFDVVTTGGEAFLWQRENSNMRFGTNATERMRIDSSGNVGIGITSPTSEFHVKGSGTVASFEGTGGSGFIAMKDSDDGTIAFVGVDGGSLKVQTSGSSYSDKVVVDTTGNVNINNTGDLDAYRLAGAGSSVRGHLLRADGNSASTVSQQQFITGNRLDSDGSLITFSQDGNQEGNISVSGSSVSYNGGVLTRWSQLKGISSTDKSARPTIYQGTVMSNLDDLCEWEGEENQQLNMTKISDTVGDKDIAGVFWAWDDDDDKIVNDFYIAMTGDMVIRVAASTTVARGDLLISAGDGTAKPQNDDIVRSSTIAKIISTTFTATYEDGSKAYPCVLMAC